MKAYGNSCSEQDLCVIEAARLVKNHGPTIAGSGLPIVAAVLASRLSDGHVVVFDSGMIGPAPSSSPISVSDPGIQSSFEGSTSLILGAALHTGRVFSAVVGAAQIGSDGRLNSSYVQHGGVLKRLPGAGGASAIVSSVKRVVVVTQHDERRFAKSCDYVSSDPTSLDSRARVPRDFFVVTDKCVLKWDFEMHCFCLDALMPNASLKDVVKVAPFVTTDVDSRTIAMPTGEELMAYRAIVGEGGAKWNVIGRNSSRLEGVPNLGSC